MLCQLGERFGTAPHLVAGWPAAVLRVLAVEALGQPDDDDDPA